MNLDVLNKIKLKKEGIATLQVFFIFIFGSLEYIVRHSFAIITGIVVLLMFILGNRFGRPGVAYVAAVTPPLAFAVLAFIWAFAANTIHLAKLGVDFIGSLASVGPWLLVGAIYGWYTFLHQRAQKQVSDARSRA